MSCPSGDLHWLRLGSSPSNRVVEGGGVALGATGLSSLARALPRPAPAPAPAAAASGLGSGWCACCPLGASVSALGGVGRRIGDTLLPPLCAGCARRDRLWRRRRCCCCCCCTAGWGVPLLLLLLLLARGLLRRLVKAGRGGVLVEAWRRVVSPKPGEEWIRDRGNLDVGDAGCCRGGSTSSSNVSVVLAAVGTCRKSYPLGSPMGHCAAEFITSYTTLGTRRCQCTKGLFSCGTRGGQQPNCVCVSLVSSAMNTLGRKTIAR